MVHSARQKFVRRAWEKAEVNEKWAQSSWAKKIGARQKVKAMFEFVITINILAGSIWKGIYHRFSSFMDLLLDFLASVA